MKGKTNRRTFLKHTTVLTAAGAGLGAGVFAQDKVQRIEGAHIKLSLNAYSFNEPLRSGEITLEELIPWCARLGFDAIDPTGYYFTGYPHAPDDDYLFALKKLAFVNGLEISGTGVKNDFTNPDPISRQEDKKKIKEWIVVASKLGAPALRVFAGKLNPPEYAWDEILEWMAPDLRECIEYGAEHGVIVAVQNHNEFLKTADETLQLLKEVDSEWFGLVLDVGSLRKGDPYEEIAKLAPYAVNWQLKEKVYRDGVEEKTDVRKVIEIARDAGYRGYIPIETLGPGDPKQKVELFYNEVRSALKG